MKCSILNFGTSACKFLAVVLVCLLSFESPAHVLQAHAQTYTHWKICKPYVKRFQCVVDGDTFWFQGQKMRLFKIDTPEIKGRCGKEKRLARKATIALRDYLNQTNGAGNLEIIFHKLDRFGRRLVEVNGPNGDIGTLLMTAGYAVPYGPRDLKKWCR